MRTWTYKTVLDDRGPVQVEHGTHRGPGPEESGARSAAGGVERAPGHRARLAPPPDNNMGVEFAVDWLTVTVEATGEAVSEMVGRRLGVDMVWRGYGGNGYRECFMDPASGAKVYCAPAHSGDWETRSTLMLPGTACGWLGVDGIRELLGEIELWHDRAVVNRIDLAFDQTLFDSRTVWEHLKEGGKVRTLAKRDTFRRIEDMAGKGTVYLGSRQSGRMLRIYDKDECTRVEMECKQDRAHAIVAHLMEHDSNEWPALAWSHLLDYVDFSSSWWEVLKQTVGGAIRRAGLTLAVRAQESLARAERFLMLQASSWLSVFTEAKGTEGLDFLLSEGRRRYKQKHRAVLQASLVV